MNQNHQDAHKRYITFHKYLAPVCGGLAAVIAVSAFLAMRLDFDSTIGHFKSGSAPWIMSVIAALAAAVCAGACSIYAGRSASFADDPGENPVTVFGSILACILGFVCMVVYAGDYSLGLLSKFGAAFTVLVPFVGISLVLAAVEKTRFSSVRKITALLAAAAVNLSLFADYFNFTLPLNSPIRNMMTVVKAAVLLYIVSEARFSFGVKSKRLNLAASVFAAGTAASLTLGYALGGLGGRLFSQAAASCPSAAELGLLAAIGIHALGRLVSMTAAIGKYIPPEPEKKKESENKKANN
jgi:hypothetical protein